MIQKLRWKIVAVIMVLVLIFFLGLDVALVSSSKEGLKAQSLQTLEEALSLPSTQIRPGEVTLTTQAFFVIDVSDTGVATAVNFGSFAMDNGTIIREIARQATIGDERVGTLEALSLRYIKKRMITGWRVACVDIRNEQQTVRQLSTTLILMTIFGLTFFFFLSWAIALITTRPVEQSLQRQQQLVADASHELKTPLTVILTCVDLLRSQPTADKAQRKRWEESIQAEAQQMKQLTEDLLFLARSDAGQIPLQWSEVDLSDLISGELLHFEPMFFESGYTFHWEVAPDLWLLGNGLRLRQLCSILLENALKDTSPGGPVTLLLQLEEEKKALLSVSSDGSPIPREDLPRLFDRFYRADPSRGDVGGHGLGLSIAKAIVEEHQGTIWAESLAGCNRFSVLLPGVWRS